MLQRHAVARLLLVFSGSVASGAEILSVTPSRVCAGGREEIRVVGSGLTSELVARLGGVALEDQRFVDGREQQEILGKVPLTLLGPQVAEVFEPRSGQVLARLPDAVDVATCEPDPTITAVEPREVSLSGSLVKIVGSSFTPELRFEVGGISCVLQAFLDPRTVLVLTPVLGEGSHDLVALSASGNPLATLSPGVFARIPPTLLECLISTSKVALIPQAQNLGQTAQVDAGKTQLLETALTAGQVGHLTSYLALSSELAGPGGAQGWTLSLSLTGTGLLMEGASVGGTVGDDAANGPPGLRSGGFEKTDLCDPGAIHPDTGLPQGQGVVSAVILSLLDPSIQLDPVGTATVLEVKVATDHPIAGGEVITGALRCRDHMRGAGQPLETTVLLDGSSNRICECPRISYTFFDGNAAPALRGVQPTLVSTRGGNTIDVHGSGFHEGLLWRLEGNPLDGVEILGQDHVRARTPPLSSGFKQLTVESPAGGALARLDRAVEAADPPEVLSIEPSHFSEGDRVRITGRNFRPETRVSIGAFGLLEAVVSEDGTEITGEAPEVDPPGVLPIRATDPRYAADYHSPVTAEVDLKLPLAPPPTLLVLLTHGILTCFYQVLPGCDRLDVVDWKTLSLKGSIDVESATAVEVSPRGKRAYLTSSNQIMTYRLSTLEPQAVYANFGLIEDARISPNGARLYVLSGYTIHVMDTAQDVQIDELDLTAAGSPVRVAVSPDGKRLACLVLPVQFAPEIHIFDAASLAPLVTFPVVTPQDPCSSSALDMVIGSDGKVVLHDRDCHALLAFSIFTGARQALFMDDPAVNPSVALVPVESRAFDWSGAHKKAGIALEEGFLGLADPLLGTTSYKFFSDTKTFGRLVRSNPGGTLLYVAAEQYFDLGFNQGTVFDSFVQELDPGSEELNVDAYHLFPPGANFDELIPNGSRTIRDFRVTGPGPAKLFKPVIPLDTNGDAALDLSDAVALLGHLFLGRPSTLPCGDGTVNDPANVLLLDANGDHRVDLSDAVHLLGFLFLGTSPPVAGTDPLEIEGCGSAGG